MRSIDLNCDMGEGIGNDAAIMPFISSANIACGAHAGDAATMRSAVRAAVAAGVAVGAHPGYADERGFGRRPVSLTSEELTASILEQLEALDTIARSEGAELRHVKPHGALYNAAARDAGLAETIAVAVAIFNRRLRLYGLSGGALIPAGVEAGLKVAREVFADRNYEPDGSLTPRSEPGAVISDPAEVAGRSLSLATEGKVRTSSGAEVDLEVDTICIHGDSPGAATMAAAIRAALEDAGIELRPLA